MSYLQIVINPSGVPVGFHTGVPMSVFIYFCFNIMFYLKQTLLFACVCIMYPSLPRKHSCLSHNYVSLVSEQVTQGLQPVPVVTLREKFLWAPEA